MKLPKKATILEAEALATAMRNTTHIDASEVEDIDTSILQLLCAFKAAAGVIDRPSPCFIDAAQRCGMEHLLLNNIQEAA